MGDIRRQGLDVRVARFQASPDISYAMFSGGGASWSDAADESRPLRGRRRAPGLAARPDRAVLPLEPDPGRTRRDRLDHRRSRRRAARRRLPATRERHRRARRRQDRDGHPVPAAGPDFNLPPRGLELEARAARAGAWLRELRILGECWLTHVLDRTQRPFRGFDPELYKRVVSQNSDFRKFDDGLKMTIDVSRDVPAPIEQRLESAAQAGICRFGMHRQDSALITCIVPSPFTDDHLHFIDGAAGGYAMASSNLKARYAS